MDTKLEADEDMLSEYDFTGGVRGKHHEALREGYAVKMHRADGTTLVQNHVFDDGASLVQMAELDPEELEILDAFEAGKLERATDADEQLKRRREYAAAMLRQA